MPVKTFDSGLGHIFIACHNWFWLSGKHEKHDVSANPLCLLPLKGKKKNPKTNINHVSATLQIKALVIASNHWQQGKKTANGLSKISYEKVPL